jgi:hypothetical protein
MRSIKGMGTPGMVFMAVLALVMGAGACERPPLYKESWNTLEQKVLDRRTLVSRRGVVISVPKNGGTQTLSSFVISTNDEVDSVKIEMIDAEGATLGFSETCAERQCSFPLGKHAFTARAGEDTVRYFRYTMVTKTSLETPWEVRSVVQ